jgi:hypothetical protein
VTSRTVGSTTDSSMVPSTKKRKNVRLRHLRLQLGPRLLVSEADGAQVPAQHLAEDAHPVGGQQRDGAGEFESAARVLVGEQGVQRAPGDVVRVDVGGVHVRERHPHRVPRADLLHQAQRVRHEARRAQERPGQPRGAHRLLGVGQVGDDRIVLVVAPGRSAGQHHHPLDAGGPCVLEDLPLPAVAGHQEQGACADQGGAHRLRPVQVACHGLHPRRQPVRPAGPAQRPHRLSCLGQRLYQLGADVPRGARH